MSCSSAPVTATSRSMPGNVALMDDTPLKLSADLSKNLPSTVAKWQGETYAVGYGDVALSMFARKSDLAAAGVRVATIEKPWTKDEFQDALTKLKALGKWEYPLDMGTAGTGEWLPDAYSPFLQSFGGDLVNRDGFQSADGELNGDKAVAWAEWFRGLADQGARELHFRRNVDSPRVRRQQLFQRP